MKYVMIFLLSSLMTACGAGPGPVLDENGRIVSFDRNGNRIGGGSGGSTSQESQPTDTTDTSSDDSGDQISTPMPEVLTSLQAYEKYLHPILVNNCMGCHQFGTAQQSHDDLVNNGFVNFNNPAQSQLSQKIAGGHNGINQALANDITAAVDKWGDHRP